MVDVAKAARFRRRFTGWRGEVVASVEEPFIATALLIAAYVDDANKGAIQLDLVDGSPIYDRFSHPHEKRTYGALLYGKLAIEDYFQQTDDNNNFAEGERKVLSSILQNLDNLYDNPRNQTAAKFHEIINHTHLWLDSWVLGHANPALTKSTLLSVYTMLKFFDIKLGKLDWAQKGVLTLLGMNHGQTKDAIQILLVKIEQKLTELELVIHPRVVIEDNVPEPVVQTIEGYYDAQCLSIIEQESPTIPEKMELIKTFLVNVRPSLSALLDENSTTTMIQAQIGHAITVLHALDTNELKVFGKQYARALINSNLVSVNSLIFHSNAHVQAEWSRRMEQLESPDFSRFAADSSQYVLSAAAALFLVTPTYRAFAPPSLKEKVTKLAPQTFDSECKAKLRELAETRLTTLREALVASNGRKELIATQIAGTNATLKLQLLAAPSYKLNEILAANHTVHQVMGDFGRLSTEIIDNQKKLVESYKLNCKVDEFLAEHNSFFVRLSLIFSHISSIFKTDTASKVERVQAIKSELRQFQEQYAQAVVDGKSAISNNPHVSDSIKEGVVAKLRTDIPHRTAHPPGRDIITEFNLINTMFSAVRPVLPVAGGEPVAAPPRVV